MNLPDDFRDLLVCLADAGAEFLVVGGHAVAFHGHPRATKDLDVLVRATRENADRVYRALDAFGAPLSSFSVGVEDFATYAGVLQIGVPPFRIDILTSLTGLSYADAAKGHEQLLLDGRSVPVIGLDALLANKQATGRDQDRADVTALQRARGATR